MCTSCDHQGTDLRFITTNSSFFILPRLRQTLSHAVELTHGSYWNGAEGQSCAGPTEGRGWSWSLARLVGAGLVKHEPLCSVWRASTWPEKCEGERTGGMVQETEHHMRGSKSVRDFPVGEAWRPCGRVPPFGDVRREVSGRFVWAVWLTDPHPCMPKKKCAGVQVCRSSRSVQGVSRGGSRRGSGGRVWEEWEERAQERVWREGEVRGGMGGVQGSEVWELETREKFRGGQERPGGVRAKSRWSPRESPGTEDGFRGPGIHEIHASRSPKGQVRRCESVQVCKRPGVQVCKCQGIQSRVEGGPGVQGEPECPGVSRCVQVRLGVSGSVRECPGVSGSVQVPRCPGDQVSRCPGFQGSRRPGAQESRCPGAQVLRCAGVQVSRSRSVGVSECAGVRECRSAGAQVRRCACAQCASAQVCKCACVQVASPSLADQLWPVAVPANSQTQPQMFRC